MIIVLLLLLVIVIKIVVVVILVAAAALKARPPLEDAPPPAAAITSPRPPCPSHAREVLVNGVIHAVDDLVPLFSVADQEGDSEFGLCIKGTQRKERNRVKHYIIGFVITIEAA
jgi:hypothetical protein